jgi:hypothetical protein
MACILLIRIERPKVVPALSNRGVRFHAAALLKTKSEREHCICGLLGIWMLHRSHKIGYYFRSGSGRGAGSGFLLRRA